MRPCSPAPISLATGMAKPLHMPMPKPMMRKLMEPVAPTAARALAPRSRPTMRVSTMLYICWNSSPSNVGIVKPRMSFMGSPFVRSLVMK